jgi:hypothetical protein
MNRRQPTRAGPEPRRRMAGYFAAAILGAAMVAAVVLVLSSGDGEETGASSEGVFGTHYSGLEDRRLTAGVPTMSDTSAGGAHIHPRLSVYVRGEEIPLPVNIGIDPSRPPQAMAGLHTHDQSGVIHVENAAQPTLGQFFEIWGVPLSSTELGPYEAKGSEQVRMWVDGEPSTEFGELVMEDGQEIVLAFGDEQQIPPGLSP